MGLLKLTPTATSLFGAAQQLAQMPQLSQSLYAVRLLRCTAQALTLPLQSQYPGTAALSRHSAADGAQSKMGQYAPRERPLTLELWVGGDQITNPLRLTMFRAGCNPHLVRGDSAITKTEQMEGKKRPDIRMPEHGSDNSRVPCGQFAWDLYGGIASLSKLQPCSPSQVALLVLKVCRSH